VGRATVLVVFFIAILSVAVAAAAYASFNGVPKTVSDAYSAINGVFKLASSGGLAQLEVSGVGLIADTFTGSHPLSPVCGSASRNSYLMLLNLGSTDGTPESVTITYGGADNVFTVSGPCAVHPTGSINSTMYILFPGPSLLPNSGLPKPSDLYVGSVALTNGAKLPFSGKFLQGYPEVTAVQTVFPAADFAAGVAGNATCASAPAPGKPYIALTNAGTLGASFVQVTVNLKGASNIFQISGPCSVGPDGTSSATIYVVFGGTNKLGSAPAAGEQFSGFVAPPTGAGIPFEGVFG